MIRNVLVFDFDFTISNSSRVGMEVFNKYAKKFYLPEMTMEKVKIAINQDPIIAIKSLGLHWWNLPFFLYFVKREIGNRILELELYDGMKELLIELKNEGFKLIVLSSNNKINIEKFLKNHGLNCFDHVLESDIFGKAGVLNKFLFKYDIDRGNVLMIGDEIRDFQASQKIGCPIALFDWGLSSRENLIRVGAKHIASNLGEMRNLIEIISQEKN